jgi:hypothetical protein
MIGCSQWRDFIKNSVLTQMINVMNGKDIFPSGVAEKFGQPFGL